MRRALAGELLADAINVSNRDRIVNRMLSGCQFPEAAFDAQSLTLPDATTSGRQVNFDVPGQITIHGVTRPATAQVQLRVQGAQAQVAGSVPVDVTDFDHRVPAEPGQAGLSCQAHTKLSAFSQCGPGPRRQPGDMDTDSLRSPEARDRGLRRLHRATIGAAGASVGALVAFAITAAATIPGSTAAAKQPSSTPASGTATTPATAGTAALPEVTPSSTPTPEPSQAPVSAPAQAPRGSGVVVSGGS